ncbi:MAG: FAD-dependent oxidoreductase [Kiritimatiellae bacterium]|jgi:NADPH-dependent 2,4-dienoyl-CoA reductase/sulfur reductase-like enzyme/rhodanese-related sulfurtransferase|nr:FAD-dependent oxidoreductase [Kiritimatiellia bacterium]
MKVVIIGGVAAGPKAGSRINRLCCDAEMTIVEKGEFLSYAGCGLPYYISGVVKERKELMSTPVGTVRDSIFFQNVKNVHVMNHTEATCIDREQRTVSVVSRNGGEQKLDYDKLVLATGAESVIPPIKGVDLENIFNLKNIYDAERIKEMLGEKKALNAVIVGGGLIGVEVAEAFHEMGCRITIVEFQSQILSLIDPEMAVLAEKHFETKGVKVKTGTKVVEFKGDQKVSSVVTDQGEIPADIVVLAVGVRPMVKLAREAGLEIGSTGAIAVNTQMQTSDSDIFAAGDCAEKKHIITGKACYIPLGSTANKEGRVAANVICGINDAYPGVLGSAICKIFDFTVACTGLGEKEARDAGYDVVTCLSPAPDKPHFMPTAKLLFLKLIADRKTRKLLGAQATGPGAADRRIDVVVTAITAGMTVDQVAHLDMTYAPPYSPAVDNLLTAANILRNKMDGYMKGVTPAEVCAMLESNKDFTLLDVRSPAECEQMRIEGSVNIPLGALRKRSGELSNEKPIIAFCKISLRGYEAALILKKAGFKDLSVMDGGILMWPGKIIQG